LRLRSSPASAISLTKTFTNVAFVTSTPDFDEAATARGWCIGKGHAIVSNFQSPHVKSLGPAGFRVYYPSINCMRGIQ
jgi:hypothetical protein